MRRRRTGDLGALERTMLAPLRARARDARRRRPVLPDPVVADLAGELDGDGTSAGTSRLDDLATVVRTAVFDHWVGTFLADHPGGTVVELGAGLSTRAQRLAGSARRPGGSWVDVDLPDVAALRRELLPRPDGRVVAGSVLDEDWLDVVRELPAPYLLVSEGVLTLLPEQGVQRIVFTVGSMLPGAVLLTDTVGRTTASHLERCEPLASGSLTFDWTCEDPAELQPWGLRLLESRGVADVPEAVSRSFSTTARARAAALRVTPRLRGHKLARYEVLSP